MPDTIFLIFCFLPGSLIVPAGIFSILAFTFMMFLPAKNLLARRRRLKKDRQRVLVEDALKHLYDCEYNNINCTVNSVAGALSISADKAADLAQRLESMGLLVSGDPGLHLSGEGRSYALRVIRIHRLLEKYFADQTSIEAKHWHKEAEEKEHLYTLDEADALAAKLGNPFYDPHGDPIPTSEGVVPPAPGMLLSSVKPGSTVKIIHIEDEPSAVYAQLIAQGLYPGMHVRLVESGKERVVFIANGEEIKLAPVVASGITVADLAAEENILGKYENLASLKQGESAVVAGISMALRGGQRRRLMDLGVVPGTVITAELVSTGGNPVAYKIREALIALRKEHAEYIFINEKINR